MKKIFLFLLPILAFCEPRPSAQDLDACYQLNSAAQFDYKGLTAVALTRHLAAAIYDANKTLEPGDYVKFDPYLKLYLIELDTTEVAPHLEDETRLGNDAWVNVLEQNATQIGHIRDFARNLGEFDLLGFHPSKKGLLLCDCCKMVGIAVGENKFVGNRYLRNFIAHKDVYYGDIGVNFDDMNGSFIVRSVFSLGARENKLAVGDKVLTLNSIVPRELREINEAILFAKPGDTLRFEVDRNGKKELVNVKIANLSADQNKSAQVANPDQNKSVNSAKKKAPKRAPDVLETYGLSVGGDLIVKSASKQALAAGFAPGDRILQVGKTPVRDIDALRRALSNYRLNYILVSRRDFQFFIRIRR